MRAVIRRVLAVLLVAALGGCGIPLDDAPRDVPGVPQPRPAPLGADSGTAVERVCLIRDDKLVRSPRRVPAGRAATDHLDDLLAGPTTAESATGLTTALTGRDGTTVTLSANRAVVDLDETARLTYEAIAFGQIVCTLGSRLDVGTISFTSGGRAIGVPRGDGSLADGRVTIADYSELIAPD